MFPRGATAENHRDPQQAVRVARYRTTPRAVKATTINGMSPLTVMAQRPFPISP